MFLRFFPKLTTAAVHTYDQNTFLLGRVNPRLRGTPMSTKIPEAYSLCRVPEERKAAFTNLRIPSTLHLRYFEII